MDLCSRVGCRLPLGFWLVNPPTSLRSATDQSIPIPDLGKAANAQQSGEMAQWFQRRWHEPEYVFLRGIQINQAFGPSGIVPTILKPLYRVILVSALCTQKLLDHRHRHRHRSRTAMKLCTHPPRHPCRLQRIRPRGSTLRLTKWTRYMVPCP